MIKKVQECEISCLFYFHGTASMLQLKKAKRGHGNEINL